MEMVEEQPGILQRYLILPIGNQITQGANPRSVTWAILAGFVTAVFPILGTTTALGVLVGFIFKLNQPVLQAVRVVSLPIQLILILPFIRMGEFLLKADPVAFSIPRMLELFKNSPVEFLGIYGRTCLHCIFAWVVCLPLLVLLYPLIFSLVKRIKVNRK